MARNPYMPLYFGDFLAATADWEGEERSLYLTLLGHQWSLGSLPADPVRLRKLVDWDRELFDRCWPVVAPKFHEAEGRLFNGRLEQHREKADSISAKRAAIGKQGADKRWQTDSKPEWQTDSNCHPEASQLPSKTEVLLCHLNQSKDKKEEGAKAPPLKASRKPTQTTLPDDFTLTHDLAAYVAKHLPDADGQGLFDKFVGQAKAKAWKYADWTQAFQTYVRSAAPNSGHWSSGQYPKATGAIKW